MNSLLEQFLSEAKDLLQGAAEKLIQLESEPGSTVKMNELFRLVHTLKGNSGLFDFPEMTRMLHAGEDLMDAVRDGRVLYSAELADRLLEAMDFVSLLVEEIEAQGATGSEHGQDAVRLSALLRELVGTPAAFVTIATEPDSGIPDPAGLAAVPEVQRMVLYQQALDGRPLLWVECRCG